MAGRTTASDAQQLALFLDMLAAEQGAGDNTIAAYRRDLADLSAFLAQKETSFARATTDDVRGYLADLDARGFKASSVARKLSALRHLFRFLLGESVRNDDPAAILSAPKRGRALPKVLSIADVDRLLAQARRATERPDMSATQRLRALRLSCLLEVLYATGLRVSELVDTPAFRARAEGARRLRRDPVAPRQPACAATCLRESPPAQRRRSSHRADTARPHRHFDDADLHPRRRGTAQEPRARPASACRCLTGRRKGGRPVQEYGDFPRACLTWRRRLT
jgi:hypothetical protein